MTLEAMDIPDHKTSLFDCHLLLKAKMISFGGYKMPVSYPAGIQSEYFAVRKNVGIFDVSHMGEFKVSGVGALKFLQKVTINDVNKLEIGQAQYSAMCYENGGIIDDLILYRGNEDYLMVVNASNIQKDYEWLCKHISNDVQIMDVSNEISLIALQGPGVRDLLENCTDLDLKMPFYSFKVGDVCDYSVMVSRTGYTGELGFEIYGNAQSIRAIWGELVNLGAKPAGLAARDILRMEMSYCLYGNDINEKTNPLEAGLGWITALDKKEFIGSDRIKKEKQDGLKKHLVSFKMQERGVPRPGYEIYIKNNIIGFVTSGNQSPSLNMGIGLAYIDSPFHEIGREIEIQVRNKYLNAIIVKPPFIKRVSLHN